MSAEPVWCLFQVKPDDSQILRQAFEAAVEQSSIATDLHRYLQRRERHARFLKRQLGDFPFFGNSQEVELNDYVNDAQLFLNGVGNIFFLRGANELFSMLRRADMGKQDALIRMAVTHRIAPTQVLYGALRWQMANRLPEYFGNMFVPPQEVAATLTCVESVFSEINAEDVLKRACAIGGSRVSNKQEANRLLFLLPSALKLVSRKGYGFIAISYPHLGSLPFFEEDEDAY